MPARGVSVGRGGAAAMILGVVALVGILPVTEAAAVTATSVTVVVAPGTTLETYTPTTFYADVSPDDATGSVSFTFDGKQIGNGTVTGGRASFSTNSLMPGTWALQAQFIPAPGSGFAASASAPVTVTVNEVARISLSYADGTDVPVGGQVKVGAPVIVSASGWPSGTVVRLAIGTVQLDTTVTTNASGSGSAQFTMPTSLRSAVYLLSASGSRRSAGFVFYVYNPPKAAATPTPVYTAPSTVISPSPISNVITVPPAPVTVTPTPHTTTVAAAPATSGDGLAGTGGIPLPLLAGAIVAVGVGGSLMGAGRQASTGRHERPRHRA